ncbi:Ras guanine nucleotide exchange factor Q [Pelomyxa schiedti]|nr:Ras guanine nucleotide exchange factor Q [Pelomyxa schiedti]
MTAEQALEWIQKTLPGDTSATQLNTGNIAKGLRSGVILSNAINTLSPQIVVPPKPGVLYHKTNIENFINGCKKLGVDPKDLFTVTDLYNEYNIPQVFRCLGALAQLNSGAPPTTPSSPSNPPTTAPTPTSPQSTPQSTPQTSAATQQTQAAIPPGKSPSPPLSHTPATTPSVSTATPASIPPSGAPAPPEKSTSESPQETEVASPPPRHAPPAVPPQKKNGTATPASNSPTTPQHFASTPPNGRATPPVRTITAPPPKSANSPGQRPVGRLAVSMSQPTFNLPSMKTKPGAPPSSAAPTPSQTATPLKRCSSLDFHDYTQFHTFEERQHESIDSATSFDSKSDAVHQVLEPFLRRRPSADDLLKKGILKTPIRTSSPPNAISSTVTPMVACAMAMGAPPATGTPPGKGKPLAKPRFGSAAAAAAQIQAAQPARPRTSSDAQFVDGDEWLSKWHSFLNSPSPKDSTELQEENKKLATDVQKLKDEFSSSKSYALTKYPELSTAISQSCIAVDCKRSSNDTSSVAQENIILRMELFSLLGGLFSLKHIVNLHEEYLSTKTSDLKNDTTPILPALDSPKTETPKSDVKSASFKPLPKAEPPKVEAPKVDPLKPSPMKLSDVFMPPPPPSFSVASTQKSESPIVTPTPAPAPPPVSLLEADITPSTEGLLYGPELRNPDVIELKGGTVPKLIEQLFTLSNIDATVYMDVFLLTYRSFTDANTVFDMLLKAFVENDPSPEEQNDTNQQSSMVLKTKTRLRIVNVLKRWCDNFFHDFEGDDVLLDTYQNFIEANAFKKEIGILKTKLDNKLAGARGPRAFIFSEPPPPPILPANVPKLLITLDDLDATELARQISLMEFDCLYSIQPKEFLSLGWSKKDKDERSPNLLVMIRKFNAISNWVTTTIVREQNIKKRVIIIKRFVRLLDELLKLNNMNAIFEVSAGLGAASITRLKNTWAEVNADKLMLKTLGIVQQLTSPHGSFSYYRETIRKANPPCIPYLGVYLSDLTFIEEGNPDSLEGGYVNFAKFKMVAAVIQEVQNYQQKPYNFTRVDSIIKMLNNVKSLSETQCFDLSLQAEPRTPHPGS